MKYINLKFWGHNCFSIESEDSVLLIDPWLSNSGAFFGSWFQYPKNHHLADNLIAYLKAKKNNFVFISHEHQDHFDIKFLERLPVNTQFLIPRYQDKDFRKSIENISKNVMELDDFKDTHLDNEITVKLIISDIGINHDSAIMVKTKNFNFLNQNDCKVFDRLTHIEESIDLYSVQFSGATWHPSCFEFSERRKELLSKQKVLNKFNNVLKGIELLKPKYFLPAAGPAIFPFLESSLSYGVGNIFVHQTELKNYLEQNDFNSTIFLRPGDDFNEESVDPILNPDKDIIEKYKDNIDDIWEGLSSDLDLQLLEKKINERLQNINDIEIKDAPLLIFNYSGKYDDNDHSNKNKIFIDLNQKTILNNFDYKGAYEEIVASKKYFNLMCHEGWQTVYLSLRAKVIRRPDIFNNDVNIFIFSDSGNIKQNFLRTRNIPKERIEIKSEIGSVYEIDRYCPHQGADLCKATITEDNMLICPRHGWKFDLHNNGSNKSSGETINAKKKT